MKILYYDCFSGISGDMHLGAMVDLGVNPEYIINELKKLPVDGYSISFTHDQRKGISGTKTEVILTHSHDHHHSHGHQAYSHSWLGRLFSGGHSHIHEQPHHHGRTFSEIKELIQKSKLSDTVKQLSIKMFTKVADAEGKIHGKPPEIVHFHEVGAVDSIVDIVGAAICIEYLKPEKVVVSPIELGGGFVTCAHGTFPVPAPATLEILKHLPVKSGAVQKETTTPTGAAILAAMEPETILASQMVIDKVGYGIGHRDNPIPNVLRICLAHSVELVEPLPLESSANSSSSVVIECNIDDMNPELFEYCMEQLFAAGADDVWIQAILMKKSRPAHKLSVLCSNQLVDKMGNILFRNTPTLGYRILLVEKKMLERQWQPMDTPWGIVRIKQGILNGVIIKSKPEYEDCLKIAREAKVSINEVYNYLNKQYNEIENGRIRS